MALAQRIAARSMALILVFSLVAGAPARPSPAPAPTPGSGNIVEVALAVDSSGPYAGQFDTLIAAVLAADPIVVAALTSNRQFTVFAPTDAAFAALGLDETNVGTLPQATLTTVLLDHVASGRLDANTVVKLPRIRTVRGGYLRQSGGVLTDNLGRSSTIIVTDVLASSGIIHAIDAVVLTAAP